MQADRDLNKLSKNTRSKVDLAMKELEGVVFITEAYRSQERQDWLYAQWRTRPWKIVTHTLSSRHTLGEAVDIAFYGKDIYPPLKDPRRKQVASVFKRYGMDWGGDWTSFKDYPHFQDDRKPLQNYIIEMFYETLYNKLIKEIPKEKRMIKDIPAFMERIKDLPLDLKLSEMSYLFAIWIEKAKWNIK